MTKSPLPALQQLEASLHEQALEIATLRATVDLQSKQIAQLQTKLEVFSRRGVVSIALGNYLVGRPH
jgi:hypothetical protein